MKKPTLQECIEYSNDVYQSELFINYFNSNGWKVGRNPMKNWKSALTGWIKRSKPKESKIETIANNPDSSIIDRIWLRLKQSFGEKFIREFGEVPTTPWIGMVSRLSNEEIAHGLTKTIELGSDWAPSVGRFRKLCKSYRQPLKSLSHLPDRAQILEQRSQTAAIRKREMDAIRLQLSSNSDNIQA